ncbi:uncharacterized protein HMPREF1541_04525 [Cyphellophora europaea CBS 101466]|uniref:DUF1742-domain-containing protein n=1 Tax=Cyphellophora europaea (strain CBS 101466) TaxID=1220924 RepID=W2RX24_CYPE1|nr:uncharacterized protein HMPREF1541_04525 [Cyphellophora europaea CBS 101466]ETN40249.1 hypothetical protein HMPREF1541_04525 [Cyphellophora europaea CBS 101466]
MSAQQALPNIWHQRAVAETAAKSCYICYKPTTAVLVTPDNKDFFYVCKTHLKDRGFASPIVDEKAEAEKRKKEALDREIEKVKQEYEEKMKQKRAKKKAKDDDKDKKNDDDEARKAEKERDDKIKALSADTVADDGPRIFALHRNFYQMRIERLRNIEVARRNQQRIKDPTFFPKAPTGDLP